MGTQVAAAVLCVVVGVAGASAQPVSFSRTDYPNDAGARGIVTADFDGDGAPDVATANNASQTVTIFLNRVTTGGGFVRAHAVQSVWQARSELRQAISIGTAESISWLPEPTPIGSIC